MKPRPELPSDIEEYRDARWRRENARQVETVLDAERFIEQVGFAAALTDARRPGPSLYVAVCGRRDAVLPRNVQKDPETSLAWTLKDDVLRRGRDVLRQAGRRPVDVPRAAHDRALPRGLGHQAIAGEGAAQRQRAENPSRAAPRMGDDDGRSSDGCGHSRAGRLHSRARRIAEGHARRPERGPLRGQIHLSLHARDWPVSRRAQPARRPERRASRDRPLLPGGSGHDDARRTGARHGPVARRRRPRQSRARGRGIRDDGVDGCVSARGRKPTTQSGELLRRLPAGPIARHECSAARPLLSNTPERPMNQKDDPSPLDADEQDDDLELDDDETMTSLKTTMTRRDDEAAGDDADETEAEKEGPDQTETRRESSEPWTRQTVAVHGGAIAPSRTAASITNFGHT